MKTNARMVAGGICAAVLLVFIVANWERAEVSFLIGTVRMPLAFLIIFSALFGAGVASLFFHLRERKHKDKPPKPA